MIAYRSIFGLSLGLLLVVTSASAQWVEFSDDTESLLTIQSFADDPTGDPYADDDEKDVAIADLNRDGWADLIVVRKLPFSNPGARQDILLMNEVGQLADRTAELAPGFISTLTDSRDVFVTDFTGDKWPDVVIANTFSEQPRFYRNAGEDGDGNWLGLVDETEQRFPVIEVPDDVRDVLFCAVWAGDVDGDDAPDIFFSNYSPSDGTRDVLFINDGAGNFTNETDDRLGDNANVAFGTGAEIRDVDNDGDNDIVKISTLYDESPFPVGQFILFNNGNGVFDEVPFQAMPTDEPYMFAGGDLNNDGLDDYLQQGDGQDFVAITTEATPDSNLVFDTTLLAPSPRTAGFGGNTKLADIDGDGFLDGAIGPIDTDIQNCGASDQIALLRNPGNGELFDPWASNNDQNFHTDPHDFAIVDLNADTCADLFMGLCSGWKVFIQTTCPPTATIDNHTMLLGAVAGGSVADVGAPDDTYLTGTSVVSGRGTFNIAFHRFEATSPTTGASGLRIAIEMAAIDRPVFTRVDLRNWDDGALDRLSKFRVLREQDHLDLHVPIPEADAYVRDSDGKIEVHVKTVARGLTSYSHRIDYLQIRVDPPPS